MRKLLIIALLFISFSGSAQIYHVLPQYGYTTGRFKVSDLLWIPTDTTTNKTGIARIGSTLYAGNGTKWTAAAGSGTTGIDSVTITSTGCVKTFSTWSGGTESVIGTVTQPNGLAPGTGIATKTTGTTFTVTAATYTINCITYQSRDTTITLTAAGDTGRIDVIKVNTSGVTTQGTGTEGEALALPSLSATELALTYVLVTDTGVTVSLPTDTALWVSVGTSIRNANTGPVNVRTHLQIGTYTPGSWLTSGAHTNTYFVAQDGFFTTNPASSSLTKNGIAQGFGNAINMWAGSNTIGTWNLVGNGTGSQFRIFGGMNPASGTGEGNGVLIDPALSPSGANSKSYNMLKIAPTYTQGVLGTGTLRGIYYNPILTSLNTSPHYFIEATSGLVKLAGTLDVTDTATWKPNVMNSSGDLRRMSYWPVGAGGGGTPTWQQSLTAGSTRTADVVSESIGKYFRFYDRSSDSQTSTTIQTDTTGLTINHVESRGTTDKSNGITLTRDGVQILYQDYENSIFSDAVLDSTKAELSAFFVSDGGKNNKLGVAPNLSKGGFYYTSESGQYYFPRNTPTSGDVLTANTGGVLEWVAPASGSTSDTIYVDAPLEAYTSGDSNKIRINPDTLAAWRASGSYTPTVTAVLNVASATGGKCFWTKVGNVITVVGNVSITTGASTGASMIHLTIPVSYVFENSDDASGIALPIISSVANDAYVYAIVDESEVTIELVTVTADSPTTITFTFSYQIP